MKLKGKKISGPNKNVVVFPRGNTDDIVLTIEATADFDKFNKLCPLPKPPMRKIDGVDVPNLKDKSYIKSVTRHSELRVAWMILTSLQATEELEWEMVNIEDPNTWVLFRQELKESGFTQVEINKIINEVIALYGMDEARLEEARERFLASEQARLEMLSSPKEEPESTPSGKPANE